MRSTLARIGLSARSGVLALPFFLACGSPLFAQGGEPQYFAIRGAKVVPVAGPPIEDATVVVARGVIFAVGKDASIPAAVRVIEGKGLTVYPGLVGALTDVGLTAAGPSAQPVEGAASGAPRHVSEPARGPEDRPNSTPWRSAADEASLTDKRIETWRDAGFTTVVSSPRTGFFPGQAAVLDLAGDRAGDLVVKPSVALPVSIRPTGGFGSGFPDSLMGVLGYEHQIFLDTDWLTKAEANYEKNPKGVARPHYDRTSAAIADALEDH